MGGVRSNGRFAQQFAIVPGEKFGHRVILRELERNSYGQRRVLVRCELCNGEQATRFHVLRSAGACLKCSASGYRTTEERFWNYAIPEPNSGCWLWMGRTDKCGYGVFRELGKSHKAHRLSLVFSGRTFDPGQVACHTCDNPACVNPDHLYIGTQRDNARDRSARGRDGGRKRRGENGGSSKLTWEEVREIRRIFAEGNVTKRGLGRSFGVSDVCIGAIVENKTWIEGA